MGDSVEDAFMRPGLQRLRRPAPSWLWTIFASCGDKTPRNPGTTESELMVGMVVTSSDTSGGKELREIGVLPVANSAKQTLRKPLATKTRPPDPPAGIRCPAND